ncbi:hypothetical protein AVEN_125671-1 [Araneus ventricosus]|uniref:Uncharacterized protein n=1 Tax=Araneus ventricosus TaxID=182803 RepID=A0A4Y2S8U2_ARAVE|nr:hypothetical protein AVEN_125671-1 [Araneus ventricosus]
MSILFIGMNKWHHFPERLPRRNNLIATEVIFSDKNSTQWGLFWYPRLGWELGWVPHVNNGTQPNREYQNRPQYKANWKILSTRQNSDPTWERRMSKK